VTHALAHVFLFPDTKTFPVAFDVIALLLGHREGKFSTAHKARLQRLPLMRGSRMRLFYWEGVMSKNYRKKAVEVH
jgi:hypothetical protein